MDQTQQRAQAATSYLKQPLTLGCDIQRAFHDWHWFQDNPDDQKMPAIQPINGLPTYSSPEEYQSIVASTPNSFSDIPPVLRHKEENVIVAIDPPLSSELSGDDDLKGTLYVLTRWDCFFIYFHFLHSTHLHSVLVFMSASGRGFQVEYPSITLHAVSRAGTRPCIYCQLDESTPGQNTDSEDTNMSELTIIPADPESCMFISYSRCEFSSDNIYFFLSSGSHLRSSIVLCIVTPR